MRPLTRRNILKTGALLSAGTLLSPQVLHASPFGLPIGLQLYSVRDLLPKDPAYVLRQLAALGYQEVEAAGFFGYTAGEVKHALKDADLTCVSAHYPLTDLQAHLEQTIAFHHELGADFIICSSPALKTPATTHPAPPLDMNDWHWNAEQFNKIGETVKAAGLRFGYHNHVPEFHKQDGLTPYDELLRLTDPALVTFEMDCGWVTVGGGDPIDYLRRYPARISMLHVKDFKAADPAASSPEQPHSAELGRGTTDFHVIFAAASKANIKHYFVEQEEFNLPPYESLKIDADYMKSLIA